MLLLLPPKCPKSSQQCMPILGLQGKGFFFGCPENVLATAKTPAWTRSVHLDAPGPQGGGRLLSSGTQPPPPLPALQAHLVTKGQKLPAIPMVAPKAPPVPWSTARATAPSPGRPTPGVVKQDKSSGGSVDTTKNTFGPTEGQHEQWREANRRRQRQTNQHHALVARPPPPSR